MRACVICGTLFQPRRESHLSCSRSCGTRYGKRHVRANIAPPNPSGLCWCGCGKPTPLATKTRIPLGHVKGQPVRYLNGHNGVDGNMLRAEAPPYEVRDMGYETPCWHWLRHTTTNGYARVTVDGVRLPGHRVYYEWAKGPVPDGLELDHLCRVKACVNPDHLEPVTRAKNTRRGLLGKLTRADLLAIWGSPLSDAEIATRYGISQPYANRLRRQVAGSL